MKTKPGSAFVYPGPNGECDGLLSNPGHSWDERALYIAFKEVLDALPDDHERKQKLRNVASLSFDSFDRSICLLQENGGKVFYRRVPAGFDLQQTARVLALFPRNTYSVAAGDLSERLGSWPVEKRAFYGIWDLMFLADRTVLVTDPDKPFASSFFRLKLARKADPEKVRAKKFVVLVAASIPSSIPEGTHDQTVRLPAHFVDKIRSSDAARFRAEVDEFLASFSKEEAAIGADLVRQVLDRIFPLQLA